MQMFCTRQSYIYSWRENGLKENCKVSLSTHWCGFVLTKMKINPCGDHDTRLGLASSRPVTVLLVFIVLRQLQVPHNQPAKYETFLIRLHATPRTRRHQQLNWLIPNVQIQQGSVIDIISDITRYTARCGGARWQWTPGTKCADARTIRLPVCGFQTSLSSSFLWILLGVVVVVVYHDGDMSHGAGVGVMILICQAGSRHSLISGSVSPSPGVTCHVSHSAPLILKGHNSATAFCVSRQQPAVSAASCLVAQCLCSQEELPGGRV